MTGDSDRSHRGVIPLMSMKGLRRVSPLPNFAAFVSTLHSLIQIYVALPNWKVAPKTVHNRFLHCVDSINPPLGDEVLKRSLLSSIITAEKDVIHKVDAHLRSKLTSLLERFWFCTHGAPVYSIHDFDQAMHIACKRISNAIALPTNFPTIVDHIRFLLRDLHSTDRLDSTNDTLIQIMRDLKGIVAPPNSWLAPPRPRSSAPPNTGLVAPPKRSGRLDPTEWPALPKRKPNTKVIPLNNIRIAPADCMRFRNKILRNKIMNEPVSKLDKPAVLAQRPVVASVCEPVVVVMPLITAEEPSRMWSPRQQRTYNAPKRRRANAAGETPPTSPGLPSAVALPRPIRPLIMLNEVSTPIAPTCASMMSRAPPTTEASPREALPRIVSDYSSHRAYWRIKEDPASKRYSTLVISDSNGRVWKDIPDDYAVHSFSGLGIRDIPDIIKRSLSVVNSFKNIVLHYGTNDTRMSAAAVTIAYQKLLEICDSLDAKIIEIPSPLDPAHAPGSSFHLLSLSVGHRKEDCLDLNDLVFERNKSNDCLHYNRRTAGLIINALTNHLN
jgi:hypothetical protein